MPRLGPCLRHGSILLVTSTALVGCAVGGPQIGPGTAAGDRSTSWGDTKMRSDGTTYHVTAGSETHHHGDSGFGVMLGVRTGPTFVKVAESKSTGIGLATDIHADFMFSAGELGFGVETTLGAQGATIDGTKYSFGGFGASAFLQYRVWQPIFFTAGFGKVFADISRHTDDASVLHKDVSTTDAGIVFGYAGATVIFVDERSMQLGAAVQVRYTTTTGDATSDKDNRDLSYQSTSVQLQLLYVKF